jgi:hypothetical protein
MQATLGDLMTSYNLFSNKDEIQVDYLIMGPGFGGDATVPFDSQAKANYLISLAQQREDCVAVISPHRGSVVDITNTNTQTDNIIKFFSPLQSSGVNFFNFLRTAFALVDHENVKITVKSLVSFYTFGIYQRKSCK